MKIFDQISLLPVQYFVSQIVFYRRLINISGTLHRKRNTLQHSIVGQDQNAGNDVGRSLHLLLGREEADLYSEVC